MWKAPFRKVVPLAFAVRARPWHRAVIVRGGSSLIAVLALAWLMESALGLSLVPAVA